MLHKKHSRWIEIRGKRISGLICRYNPVTHQIEVKRGRIIERLTLPIDTAKKIEYNKGSQ
jgi:hypothetical protein